MAWVKIDDAFYRHEKRWELDLDSIGLFVLMLCYCNDKLTDGFVPSRFVQSNVPKPDRRGTVKALIETNMVEKAEDGYLICGYLDFQPSREEVLKRRAVRAEAGRRGGESKWRKDRVTQGMRQSLAKRMGVLPGGSRCVPCAYCPVEVVVDWSNPKRVRFVDAQGRPTPEVDHVVPLAAGGPHNTENMVLACLSCNRKKGARTDLSPSNDQAGEAA